MTTSISPWFVTTNVGHVRMEDLGECINMLCEGLADRNNYGFGKGRIIINNINCNDTFNISAYKTQNDVWYLAVRIMSDYDKIRFIDWTNKASIVDIVMFEIEIYSYKNCMF
jgi:hypothetical protein